MNTIWLKIAGVTVVAVVVLIIGSKFMGGDDNKPEPAGDSDKPKTFYDMAERDKQLTEPPKPGPVTETEPATQPPTPTESQVEQAPQPATQPPAQTRSNIVLPSDITKPTTMYFKPLGDIEDIEAQRQLEMVGTGRSLARLPVTHAKLMVDACRRILQQWPDSWYAFRAKQALEDMPERFRGNYKVTEKEMDISMFLKQRRGTQPMTVEPM